jgi:hypothetical protein
LLFALQSLQIGFCAVVANAEPPTDLSRAKGVILRQDAQLRAQRLVFTRPAELDPLRFEALQLALGRLDVLA